MVKIPKLVREYWLNVACGHGWQMRFVTLNNFDKNDHKILCMWF